MRIRMFFCFQYLFCLGSGVVRGTVGVGLFLFLVQYCWAGPAPDCPDISKRLDSLGVVWDKAKPMVLNGVAVCATSFTSAQTAVETAQKFSTAYPVFERVLGMPDQLVMSGVNKDWHWVATIQLHHSGTAGFVSAMHTKTISEPLTDDSWLPLSASPVFSYTEEADGTRVHQRGYHFDWPLKKVRTEINTKLTRLGWARQSDTSGITGQSIWRRNNDQLSILIFSNATVTSLIAQHATKGGGK